MIDGGLGRTHRRSSAHVPTSDGYQLPPQNILELVMLRAHTIGRLFHSIMLFFYWIKIIESLSYIRFLKI